MNYYALNYVWGYTIIYRIDYAYYYAMERAFDYSI